MAHYTSTTNQSTLGDYESVEAADTGRSGDTSSEQEADTDKEEKKTDESPARTPAEEAAGGSLPARWFTWSPRTTETTLGIELVTPTGKITSDTSSQWSIYLREGEVGYITDGIEQFLAEHGGSEVSVPAYYSRFEEEFSPQVGFVSAVSGAYGYGIDAKRLEAGIRVATGKGRFNANDLTVVLCGRRGIVFRAPDGDFLLTPTEISQPDGHSPPTHEVAGLSVPEEYADYREGIATAATLLQEWKDVELTAHEQLRGGTHYVRAADGREVRLKSADLRKYADLKREPAAVCDEYEYETRWGESYTCRVTSNEVEYALGETVYDVDDDPVIGFGFAWEDPRRSSRVSLSGRVKAKLLYHRLYLSEYRDGEAIRPSINTKTTTVAEFDTKNREYNPTTGSI